MIIYFTEVEPTEQEFFANHLPEHDVRFVSELEEVDEDADILSTFIYSKITAEFLAKHPHLKFVCTRSTATEHIDLGACGESGVTVSSVPFYGDTTVAEHTFALILALSRRLREVMLAPKNGRFSYEGTRGFELSGKTLGILGMGRIGRRVADLARAFNMRVLAFDVRPLTAAAEHLGFQFVSLDELLATSDILSLHASLCAETYHILNRESLAKCKRGVLIVNTARGSLLDTHALREALDSGQVGGAGLDVLQDERVMRASASSIISADIVQHLRSDAVASEEHDADRIRELQELVLSDSLLSRSNVVFTPHVAFNSQEATQRMRSATLANIAGFTSGKPINLVTQTADPALSP